MEDRTAPASTPSADENLPLILALRDVCHVLRLLYEGKGSQKGILIALGVTGPITQRALTELLGIQPGSVSEVLTKLEHSGLIQRVPCKADRRTVTVSLTPEGARRAAQLRQQRIARHDEMFSCLSDSEKDTLLRLLQALNQDWASRYGGQAAP